MRGWEVFIRQFLLFFHSQQCSYISDLLYIYIFDLICTEEIMSLLQSTKTIQSILSNFSRLLQQIPPQYANNYFTNFDQKFKKIIEPYTGKQALQVLLGLAEKSNSLFLRKNWKCDETNYLMFIIDKYSVKKDRHVNDYLSEDWENVSQYMPERTGGACKFRFLTLAPTSISNSPWTSQERVLLLRVIQNQKSNSLNWKVISQKLYDINPLKLFRTGKQCRQHYACFLRPNLKKGSWTDQEDYQLICLFLKYGKKWSKMITLIEGRNENSIKNRFFSLFQNKKQIRLTNSDLVKIVKRKKEKIERKLQISHRVPQIEEEKVLLTSFNSEQSKDDDEVEEESSQRLFEEESEQSVSKELLIKEEQVKFEYLERRDTFIQHVSENEFERYIDF